MTDDEEPTPVRPRRSPFESDERRGTSPIALLERDTDQTELELAERLQRTDPAVLAVRLARQLERDRRRRDDSDELSNQVAVAIDEQRKATDWLRDNVRSLLASRSAATKIGGAIAGGIVAALVVIAQALWARAEAEGAMKSEQQHMQKTQEKHDQQIEKLGQQVEQIMRQVHRTKDSNP